MLRLVSNFLILNSVFLYPTDFLSDWYKCNIFFRLALGFSIYNLQLLPEMVRHLIHLRIFFVLKRFCHVLKSFVNGIEHQKSLNFTEYLHLLKNLHSLKYDITLLVFPYISPYRRNEYDAKSLTSRGIVSCLCLLTPDIDIQVSIK